MLRVQASGDAISMKMRKMYRVTKGMLAVLLGLTSASCGGRSSDMNSNVYADRSAAERDGAIRRGWIPKNIPPSSRDISEAHNLDTNESWITLVADKRDLIEFTRGCSVGADPDVADGHERSQKLVGWWPDALASSEAAMRAGLNVLKCTDDDRSGFIIFIDDSGSRVWLRSR